MKITKTFKEGEIVLIAEDETNVLAELLAGGSLPSGEGGGGEAVTEITECDVYENMTEAAVIANSPKYKHDTVFDFFETIDCGDIKSLYPSGETMFVNTTLNYNDGGAIFKGYFSGKLTDRWKINLNIMNSLTPYVTYFVLSVDEYIEELIWDLQIEFPSIYVRSVEFDKNYISRITSEKLLITNEKLLELLEKGLRRIVIVVQHYDLGENDIRIIIQRQRSYTAPCSPKSSDYYYAEGDGIGSDQL